MITDYIILFYQVLFNNLIFYHKIQLYINILSILNNITDKSETYIYNTQNQKFTIYL